MLSALILSVLCQIPIPTPSFGGTVLIPAGQYTVTLKAPGLVTSGDGWVLFSYKVLPVPTPEPAPGPALIPALTPTSTPTPNMVSMATHLWMIGIFDTENLTGLPIGQRELRVSPTIAKTARAANISWKEYDNDDPILGKWKDVAEKIGLPALIVADDRGTNYIKLTGKYPLDEKAAVGLIKYIRRN